MKQKNKTTLPKKTVSDNKYLNYLLFVLFAALLVFISINRISGDDDFYWHLATGRYIVETHSVPSSDVFGFATAGEKWIPFEWGWDVLTYLLFNVAGYSGVYALTILIVLTLFYFLGRTFLNFGTSPAITIFSLLLILIGVMYRITIRPHLISYLGFSVLLFVITKIRYTNNYKPGIIYSIPVVFLIWANFHMGVLAGFVILSIYILSECITLFRQNKQDETLPDEKIKLKKVLLVYLLSAVSLLINPHFIDTFIYAYNSFHLTYLGDISEWQSPFDERFSSSFFIKYYEVLLVMAVIAIFYSYRKKDSFIFAITAVFSVYSTRAIRFTIDYIFIVPLFIFSSLYLIIENLKKPAVKNFLNYSPVFKSILAVLIIIMLINIPNNVLFNKYLGYRKIWGTGPDEKTLPLKMFEFAKNIKLNEIGSRPFNHYSIGGLYLWYFPGSRNFIDSRNLSVKVYNDYDVIDYLKPGFENKLKSYNFDYFMYFVDVMTQTPSVLKEIAVSYLGKNRNEWKVIYWDDVSFIFVRNEPKFQQLISQYDYKYINPYNYYVQRQVIDSAIVSDRERVVSEIQRKRNDDPNSFILNAISHRYNLK